MYPLDSAPSPQPPLETFRARLQRNDIVSYLRQGVIGDGISIPGPFGPKPLLYADYVASGRALRQVEDFVAEVVLPFYANSHTEASFCGTYISRLRREARSTIARLVKATDEHAVIFAGSGSTAGINRLVHLLGVRAAAAAGERPVVIVGPYEHHSNLLPWRESGADVVEVGEAPTGGPDLAELEMALVSASGRLTVGAFSAASNVTGALTDVDAVTRLLRRHNALAVWDYAAAGPYLRIDMAAGTDAAKDAVVVSPHKFPGGPGSSGILIVRKATVVTSVPTMPGGGSVSFVSPWGHDYTNDLASREEAGTPNVVGDVRAALAFLAKEAVGEQAIAARQNELRDRALRTWSTNPNLELLGAQENACLPIFSFRVRGDDGELVHHQLFTRMLSDHYGIQARGGCACAGPYAHRLLNLDQAASAAVRNALAQGDELSKPGWVRLNFSYLLDDAKADRIIEAVDALARDAASAAAGYRCDTATARFFAA